MYLFVASQYITLMELEFYFSNWLAFFLFLRINGLEKSKLQKRQVYLKIRKKKCAMSSKEKLLKHPHPLVLPLPRQKCPLHSQGQCMIKGTYADVAVTSCHPLAMFCFSSCRELIPSFRLISARCFSFAANT